jgi:dihydrofolate reductase
MRKIITTTFVTADGVMQAPGGPTEDTSGGFEHGGWVFPYWDKTADNTMDGFMKIPFELLLGKRTYDIWAPYWPTQDNDIAKPFNSTKKYVVSHHPTELSWNNSVLITGDVAAEIRTLKEQDGPDLWVHGSGNLIQTLLKHHLIDVMHIWTFPVTVGNGKRLFQEGIPPQEFKLVDSKISPNGVVIATYVPGGPLRTGSFVENSKNQ